MMGEVKVVYIVRGLRGKEYVTFGLTDGEATRDGRVYIDYLEKADYRYVNGVHIDAFKNEEEWKKLPKGWSYDTELFTVEDRTPEAVSKRLSSIRMDDPGKIMEAYREGLLVLSRNVFHGNIEAEIEHGMYRIVKRYPAWTLCYGHQKMTYTREYKHHVFDTYGDAKRHIEEIRQKRLDEAEPSDLEFSWKEAEKVLRQFDAVKAKRYRNALKEIKDFDDVEVRKRNDRLWWRYFTKRTDWTEVAI